MKEINLTMICELIERACKCPSCRELAEAAIEEYEALPLYIECAAKAMADVRLKDFVENNMSNIIQQAVEKIVSEQPKTLTNESEVIDE